MLQFIVDEPKEGESLKNYLQRLSDEDVLQILDNDDALAGFCHAILVFKNSEGLDDPRLRNLLKRMEDVYNPDYILSLMHEIETVRENLLNSLNRSQKEIQKISTFTKFENLIGSGFDVTATVAALLMQDSYPLYSNLAFSFATCFGVVKLSNSLSEFVSMTTTLQNLTKEIQYDQEVFDPIRNWSTKLKEIESEMHGIFPIDFTQFKMKDVTVVSDKANIPINAERLLAELIKSAGEPNNIHLKNENVIQNLINFSTHPAVLDVLKWIIFRRHEIDRLDTQNKILKVSNRNPLYWILLENAVMASSALMAFKVRNQKLKPLLIWGRNSLNSLNICEILMLPRYREISTILQEIKLLSKHLNTELEAMKLFAKFIILQRQGKRKLMSENKFGL